MHTSWVGYIPKKIVTIELRAQAGTGNPLRATPSEPVSHLCEWQPPLCATILPPKTTVVRQHRQSSLRGSTRQHHCIRCSDDHLNDQYSLIFNIDANKHHKSGWATEEELGTLPRRISCSAWGVEPKWFGKRIHDYFHEWKNNIFFPLREEWENHQRCISPMWELFFWRRLPS